MAATIARQEEVEHSYFVLVGEKTSNPILVRIVGGRALAGDSEAACHLPTLRSKGGDLGAALTSSVESIGKKTFLAEFGRQSTKRLTCQVLVSQEVGEVFQRKGKANDTIQAKDNERIASQRFAT